MMYFAFKLAVSEVAHLMPNLPLFGYFCSSFVFQQVRSRGTKIKDLDEFSISSFIFNLSNIQHVEKRTYDALLFERYSTLFQNTVRLN